MQVWKDLHLDELPLFLPDNVSAVPFLAPATWPDKPLPSFRFPLQDVRRPFPVVCTVHCFRVSCKLPLNLVPSAFSIKSAYYSVGEGPAADRPLSLLDPKPVKRISCSVFLPQ